MNRRNFFIFDESQKTNMFNTDIVCDHKSYNKDVYRHI